MNQDITISKSIISFLLSHPPSFYTNDAQKCVAVIEQNYFVGDDKLKHFKTLINELDLAKDSFQKRLINELIIKWITDRKKLIKDFNYSDNFESCIKLAEKTIDKIYFDPSDNFKYQADLISKEVEIHNKETFISPKANHKLKNIPTRIKLEKDKTYDIVNILKPFLINAKFIKIIDPFLINPKALTNLEKLFTSIKITNLELVIYSETYFLKKYTLNNLEQYKRNYKRFKDYINSIKKDSNKIIINHFESSGHKERYILTEKIVIKIPGGLDFLSFNGRPNIKNDSTDIFYLEIDNK